jgi:nitroreductase
MDSKTSEKLDLIFGRRSIRVYRQGRVSEEAVKTMLEAAMAAPSAAAKDPWRFVVIRELARLTELAEVLPHGRMLATAALGIVVCGDLEAAHDGQISYLLQDCSAAIENLLLAAHALGLGACWLGIHPREERIQDISRVLALPPSIVPVSAIAIGLPGEHKESRSRYNDAYVRQEKWS